MPTSSQAMILRNIESNVPSNSRILKMKTAEIKDMDINYLFDAYCHTEELKYLEKFIVSNEDIRKRMNKFVQETGSRIYTYNQATDDFKWETLKEASGMTGHEKSEPIRYRAASEATFLDKRHVRSTNNDGKRHGKSINDDGKETPEFKLPERIYSLGFRDPKRPKSRNDINSPVQRGKTKSVEKEEIKSETIISSTIKEVKEEMYMQTIEEKNIKDHVLPPLEEWCYSKYEDRCYPAYHVCKELPEKRPLTVVFSLPENEKYCHAEIKQLLTEAFNCNIVRIQFDPLSVRAGDVIVRNRWIVDVSNWMEVDRMISDGFKLDNVQIVIKKMDDIALREYTTYQYREKICKEKDKLRDHVKNEKDKLRDHVKKVKSVPTRMIL